MVDVAIQSAAHGGAPFRPHRTAYVSEMIRTLAYEVTQIRPDSGIAVIIRPATQTRPALISWSS